MHDSATIEYSIRWIFYTYCLSNSYRNNNIQAVRLMGWDGKPNLAEITEILCMYVLYMLYFLKYFSGVTSATRLYGLETMCIPGKPFS